MRRVVPLLITLTLGALPARAADKSNLPLVHDKLGRFWMFLMPIEAEVALGWAAGWEHRDVEGAFVELGLGLEPQLRFKRGRFRVRAPLSFDQRLTLGFALPQTRLGAGLIVSGRLGDEVELGGGVRIGRRWRPDWTDFYQPILEGDAEPPYALATTDRYGRTRLLTELALEYTPSREVEVELDLELEQLEDDRDPHYDPVLAPTHLVPNDLRRWGVALRLRTEPVHNRLHAGLRFGLDAIDYLAAFARDAGTGKTHAGLGGDPANPLQSFLRWSLAPDLSLFVPDLKTRLSLDLRWIHNDDRFQDYYTWDRLGGTLGVRVRPVKDLKVELDYGLDLTTYTRSGYQPGPSHAPLDDGEVRARTSHELGLEVAGSLEDDRLEPFASFRWRRHDDTMPDYEPWENPPGEPYAVDFDADYWALRIGLRLAL